MFPMQTVPQYRIKKLVLDLLVVKCLLKSHKLHVRGFIKPNRKIKLEQ
jgi:hypothetical protein